MFNIEKLIKEYNVDGKSVRDLAADYNTYPNKIARTLKGAGITLRSKEEAGRIAFDKGKIIPPMLGKKRTDEEKENISTKRTKIWKEMCPDKRENFKQEARSRWNALSDEDRLERQVMAGAAVRIAAKEGSKAEKFVYKGLTKLGYDVTMHETGIVPQNYEVDLYFPTLKVAIEIDGPTHFYPIHGEDALARSIEYDSIKNGVLISRGICVIRIKYLIKHSSLSGNKKLLGFIVDELKKIETNFPDENHRLIELEFTND
jgi:hypothetical protein